jgi:hypothetical protein
LTDFGCVPSSTAATGREPSPRLRDHFGNGKQFYAQAGQVIALAQRRLGRPQHEFLETTAPNGEDLAARALASLPSYRSVPGTAVYHIGVG